VVEEVKMEQVVRRVHPFPLLVIIPPLFRTYRRPMRCAIAPNKRHFVIPSPRLEHLTGLTVKVISVSGGKYSVNSKPSGGCLALISVNGFKEMLGYARKCSVTPVYY
jgi:hypothetical protein